MQRQSDIPGAAVTLGSGILGNDTPGVMPRAQDVIGTGLTRFPDAMVILTEAARIAETVARPSEALAHREKAIALHGEHPAWVLGRDRARDAVSRLEGRAIAGT